MYLRDFIGGLKLRCLIIRSTTDWRQYIFNCLHRAACTVTHCQSPCCWALLDKKHYWLTSIYLQLPASSRMHSNTPAESILLSTRRPVNRSLISRKTLCNLEQKGMRAAEIVSLRVEVYSGVCQQKFTGAFQSYFSLLLLIHAISFLSMTIMTP